MLLPMELVNVLLIGLIFCNCHTSTWKNNRKVQGVGGFPARSHGVHPAGHLTHILEFFSVKHSFVYNKVAL